MRSKAKKIDEWKCRLPNGAMVAVEVRLVGTSMFATCPILEGFGRTSETTDLAALRKMVDAKLQVTKPIDWKPKILIEYEGADAWGHERGGTEIRKVTDLPKHDSISVRPTLEIASIEQGEEGGKKLQRSRSNSMSDAWSQDWEREDDRIVAVLDDTPANREALDVLVELTAKIDVALAAMISPKMLAKTLKDATTSPARVLSTFGYNLQRSLHSLMVDIVGEKEAQLRKKRRDRKKKK